MLDRSRAPVEALLEHVVALAQEALKRAGPADVAREALGSARRVTPGVGVAEAEDRALAARVALVLCDEHADLLYAFGVSHRGSTPRLGRCGKSSLAWPRRRKGGRRRRSHRPARSRCQSPLRLPSRGRKAPLRRFRGARQAEPRPSRLAAGPVPESARSGIRASPGWRLAQPSDSIFFPAGESTSQPAPNAFEPSPLVCPAFRSWAKR